ncbi:hypothetical protein Tco_1439574, partial [Tanacetum coccineum]
STVHRYYSSVSFIGTIHSSCSSKKIIDSFIALMDEQTTATLGGFQGRQGGGGDQGELLPRSMRLDVHKFPGVDLDSWIFAITEYFSLLNTPADQRLRIVGFNLEGAVAERFWWMTRNGLITDRDRFVESVKSRFGPSKYEDPQGALSKLLQLGILVSRPTTLGDAFALARVTDARLEGQTAALTGGADGMGGDVACRQWRHLNLNSLIGPRESAFFQLWKNW